jgi:hypothetical protein
MEPNRSADTLETNEQEAAAARRRRDRELTMSERLERVHQLCAQLAALRPIPPAALESPDG